MTDLQLSDEKMREIEKERDKYKSMFEKLNWKVNLPNEYWKGLFNFNKWSKNKGRF